jgi:uncharacterized protein YkwD
MLKVLAHLFIPQPSNNYKAKSLHLSSLSTLMLLIMLSQVVLTAFARTVPGVLGIATSITAQQLIDLTNKKRQENGLSVLTPNATLNEAAQQKAADMIAKNYWSHTSPDGLTPWTFFKNSDYKYLYAGENLARDFNDSSGVVEAWMQSPTHRDNILSSRYRDIGMAVVHADYQGQPTTLVVQLFGSEVNTVPEIAREQIQVAQEAVLAQVDSPRFNSFAITRGMTLGLTLILFLTIVIDVVVISKKKIIRVSGKGFGHLIFLGILLLVLLGIQPGLIL